MSFATELHNNLVAALTILKENGYEVFLFTNAGKTTYKVRSLNVYNLFEYHKVNLTNFYDHQDGWGVLFDFALHLDMGEVPTEKRYWQ